MSARRRICVATGSRADYGLLAGVMKAVAAHDAFELQVAVTGAHLDPAFGETWRDIEADGFRIDARIDARAPGDDPAGVARAIGLGTTGFGEALAGLRPHLLLVLGDRYEILAAVQAALVANIPVAHIAGGDATEGAFDDAIRHCITKMSQLHFVTHEDAARRVRQLGENPARVFNFGSPGVDAILQAKLLPREALERSLGIGLQARNLLVTFHPVTLEPRQTAAQLEELLAALEAFVSDTGIVLTGANADPQGRAFSARLQAFAARHGNAHFFTTLGQQRYLSAMALVDAVVGNSSSALYEAPSLRKPAVNIGDRQRGRPRAPSVIDCAPRREAIVAAIREAVALDCRQVTNPYGDGHAAPRIVQALAAIPDFGALVKKPFFDLPVAPGAAPGAG